MPSRTAAADVHRTYALILAGGQSSRLFPFNKVVSDLTASGRSLIQQAADRLETRDVYVLTNRDMAIPIRRQLRLSQDCIFTDPVRRGTWPALLWAMAHLRQKSPGAVLAIVTGDQVIPKGEEFQKAFQQAVKTAGSIPSFVVIPVKPSRNSDEWLGFGAVRVGGAKGEAARKITGFEEKPALSRARQMIREGGWFWNAGMFFFRMDIAENVLHDYHPEMFEIYRRVVEAVAAGKTKQAEQAFSSLPEKIRHPIDPKRQVDNTVDYAILMPLVHHPLTDASVLVTRQSLTKWADLGQWDALRKIIRPDRRGNIRIGHVRLDAGVRNCILAADVGCRIDARGIKGLVVAFSGGRALIIPESQAGHVKQLVAAHKGNLVTDGVSGVKVSLRGRRLIVSAA